ncbi:MAG: signal peptidase I [Mycobacteriales bacterium]
MDCPEAAPDDSVATDALGREPVNPEEAAAPGGSSKHGKGRHGQGSFLRELPILLLVAVGLALLIKTFLVQAFYIPSGSMEQTLHIGDRVLVNKLVYHLRSIHRGEIVVFNTKGTNFAQADESQVAPPSNTFVRGVRDVQCFLGLGCPGETDFIKRVIGLPGDTISCCDALGRVVEDGTSLIEPYVYQNDFQTFCAGPDPAGPPSHNCPPGSPPVTVQKGMLFVMGDHRGNSADSRTYGQLLESKVIGRAFLRIWPPSRIGFLRVPSTFSKTSQAAAPLAGGVAVTLPLGLWMRRRSRRRWRQRGAGALGG